MIGVGVAIKVSHINYESDAMRDTGPVSRVYQDPDPGQSRGSLSHICPSGLHLAEKLRAATVGSVLSLPAAPEPSYDLVSPIAQFLIAQLSSCPRPVPQLDSTSTGHRGSSASTLACINCLTIEFETCRSPDVKCLCLSPVPQPDSDSESELPAPAHAAV